MLISTAFVVASRVGCLGITGVHLLARSKKPSKIGSTHFRGKKGVVSPESVPIHHKP